MTLIKKTQETMSAKERVRRTFQFEKTDRVTIGYESNPGIHGRLAKALGIPGGDMEQVYQALGVDYRGIAAPYIGPDLFEPVENRRFNLLEGSRMRWIEHASGGYWDFCDFPLAGADEEAFARFPVPNPDHFDYSRAAEQARSWQGAYGLYAGSAGIPDIINSNGRIMGMEDILCHLALSYEPALRFIHRRVAWQLAYMERLLEHCRGEIDFMWLGEDLGTQIAPMISLELYRKHLKPIHKQFCDLAAQYNIPVQIHTCGSSSWAYEDFLEIGVRGVDTLQPEAVNMSPQYLVDRFGGRLTFRGCISTAGPLTSGTPDEVTRVCRETLDIMTVHQGYHFAPTHQIQDNSPVDNVLAMYQAAHQYGRYA